MVLFEFDQNVDVTVRLQLAANGRAEKGQLPDMVTFAEVNQILFGHFLCEQISHFYCPFCIHR
jgi:hypothetical protein